MRKGWGVGDYLISRRMIEVSQEIGVSKKIHGLRSSSSILGVIAHVPKK
jgi:hypothetical protein